MYDPRSVVSSAIAGIYTEMSETTSAGTASCRMLNVLASLGTLQMLRVWISVCLSPHNTLVSFSCFFHKHRLALCGRVSTALFRENFKCSSFCFSNAFYPSLSLFSYLSFFSSLHLASSAPLLPPYPLLLPLLPPSSLRVFKMPPGVTNRDLVQFISKQHDEATNTTYLLFRNATHPAVPEKKELVRSDWHRYPLT